MAKLRYGNNCEAISINEADDNTVKEGYISSEQLAQEMREMGKATVSYIEKMKGSMSEADKQALNEQIQSQAFRTQLRKAAEDSKEKINSIYERAKLSKSINEQKQNIENLKSQITKNYEELEKTILKNENELLKKAKKTTND